MPKMERQHPLELELELRRTTFSEVSGGFDPARARLEADRCLNCKNAPCRRGCPVGVDIPGFIRKLKEGDAEGALSVIKQTNNLPAVCGRVCPQEHQCEALCVRGRMEGPVAIGTLERYAADHGGNPKEATQKPNGRKVAVVGSGPAGLTCAADLAKAGTAVTVFENLHRPGGVLVYGIPEFRLPKDLVQREIEGLTDLGVTFRLNTVAGKTVTLEQLRRDFDAVFLGTGAGLPMFLNIPGENLNGVCSANEYLTRINLMKAYLPDAVTPVQRGKQVIVVGAGNVAMDAARTAVRMGAERVTVVYRRGREEMPARREEVRHAEEEGVVFCLLSNPVEVLGRDHVEAVRCIRMELGEPDASGRRRPVPVPGSEFEIPCDMLIVSLGTVPNPMLKEGCLDLAVTPKGTLEVDDDLATSLPGVFAGGDAVTGAATVILAMGAGKKAAQSILRWLDAQGQSDPA